jgi:ABC-2 type transport system permease protein
MVMAGQLIFFAFYTGGFAAQTILKEEEEWTLQRLFTTPTSRTKILGGKFVAIFLMVIVQVTTLVVLSALAFRIHWGNLTSLVLVIVGLVVAAGGFGLFAISWVKTTRQAGMILGGLLTFCGMLSGLFTVAVPNMPKAFTVLGYFFPQGWALKGWILVLDGAMPREVILPALVTIGMGVVFFALGSMTFRRRYA